MPAIDQPVPRDPSVFASAWRRVARSPLYLSCVAVVALYTAMWIYGEVQYVRYQIRQETAPYNQVVLADQYIPPSFVRPLPAEAEARSPLGLLRHWSDHPLGTDGLGRDVLQRLIQGTRIAFRVGLVTSMIAIPIGILLGLIGGYFGGRVDDMVVWVYSSFASIPGLLFVLAIATVVGHGLLGVYLGIGLTTWVGLCRLIRAEVLKHKGQTYVLAAQALGFRPLRIMFRHILPNVFHIVIVTFTIRFPAAVSTEVILSFLGIGVQGEPSWGIMISNARMQLWQGVWWEITAVTLAIFFLVLAFNLLGDALRDALDPRLRGPV